MRRNKWRNVRLSQIGDYDMDSGRLKVLIGNLCEEIHFNYFQPEVVEFIKRNILGFVLEPIWMLLTEYGNYDILYVPDNREIPEKRCQSLVFIDERICLIKQRYSIPLVDYLVYYQDHGPSKVVAEYAGLPVDVQEYTYQRIVDFFRQQLAEKAYATRQSPDE